MTPLVVVARQLLDPTAVERLERSCRVVTLTAPTPAAFIAEGKGAAAIISMSPAVVDASVMDALRELRIVACFGSGADTVDLAAATARDIPVANNAGVAPTAVVEYSLGAMVALRRRFGPMIAAMHQNVPWQPKDPLETDDVAGCTLGVVGFGFIGAELARRARAAFDVEVLAWGGTSHSRPAWVRSCDSLAELLPRCDILSVNVPLTPDTWHLIGPAQLALMKPSAILINTSRGPVVDEVALSEALRAGRLAGAAVDVFAVEPPPQEVAKMFDLPNVIVTPHIAGYTTGARRALSHGVVDTVLTALAGQRPARIVNGEVWPEGERRAPCL